MERTEREKPRQTESVPDGEIGIAANRALARHGGRRVSRLLQLQDGQRHRAGESSDREAEEAAVRGVPRSDSAEGSLEAK